MGFFDFLKKKKEVSETISIKSNELEKWIDENIRERKENANASIEELYKELDEAIAKSKSCLKGLREYKIRTAKTTEIVSKYREIYADIVEEFLNDIEKNRNKPAKELIVYYINRRAGFSKQSFKSFHVASELIGKPLEKIIDNFKEIDRIFKGITEILENELSKSENLKKSALNLNSLIKLKEDNQNAISKTSSSIDELNNQIAHLKNSDEALKKSEKYHEKERLKSEISNLSESIKQKKEAISLAFNSIQKNLKRLEHSEQNKHSKELLRQLIENPLDVLAEKDQITALLKTLRNRQVSCAPKTREFSSEIEEDPIKIENALASLSLIAEIRSLEHNFKELSKKDESIKLDWSNEKVKELEDDIRKINILKGNYEEKQTNLSDSIEQLKKEIEVKISEYLGKNVTIA